MYPQYEYAYWLETIPLPHRSNHAYHHRNVWIVNIMAKHKTEPKIMKMMKRMTTSPFDLTVYCSGDCLLSAAAIARWSLLWNFGYRSLYHWLLLFFIRMWRTSAVCICESITLCGERAKEKIKNLSHRLTISQWVWHQPDSLKSENPACHSASCTAGVCVWNRKHRLHTASLWFMIFLINYQTNTCTTKCRKIRAFTLTFQIGWNVNQLQMPILCQFEL